MVTALFLSLSLSLIPSLVWTRYQDSEVIWWSVLTDQYYRLATMCMYIDASLLGEGGGEETSTNSCVCVACQR